MLRFERVVSVNDAWRRFASANVIQGSGNWIGLNYLEVCDRARAAGSFEANTVAEGIRLVLDGGKKGFSVEYPCHSPTEQRLVPALGYAPARRPAGRRCGHACLSTSLNASRWSNRRS
jgi:hypothetical protein